MSSTIDRIASGEFQEAILEGLEPYAQALLRRRPDEAHSFGFDITAASRPSRVKILSPLAGGLLVATVGVQLAEGDFLVSQATMGDLEVFVLPPQTGTGDVNYPGTALYGTEYPRSAMPMIRKIGSKRVRAEAVFGITALVNDESRTPVRHAMRVEKLIIDPTTGKVIRAAMLGQTDEQFAASLRDHVSPEPSAILTIAAYGETAGSTAAWLSDREAIFNGTQHTLVLGRISITEGTGSAQLDIFRQLEAEMPAEIAA